MMPVHLGEIMKTLWLRCVAWLVLIFLAIPAHALTGEWQVQPQGQVRLIASDQAAPGKLYAALQFKLAGEWHVYWRSPGDAGVPPQADWKNSENLKSATFQYPMPTLYAMQGLLTEGYKGDVVFPLLIEKTDPAQGVKLKGELNVLVCSDICVPAKYSVALDIPAGAVATQEATDTLKTWLAKVPKQDDGTGLTLQSASLLDNNVVQITYSSPTPLTDVEVIIEPGDGSVLPLTATKIEGNFVDVTLGAEAPVKDSLGKEITFTLLDKTTGQAVEKKLALSAGTPVAAAPLGSPGTSTHEPAKAPMPANLWLMIGFALLGGLVLNLMPCVLPVLALKALAFASHGGGTTKGVRLSFLCTSAGILFSFLVMAVALIGLREAGMSVGWGVQFQNPWFLGLLFVLLIMFAANMWGFFEITLPRFLADRLSWTQGHGSLLKDFFSGAFATLLATPCTAPFLSAAVSFALAGGPVEILAIFTALGVGLALPFLLIAAFPRAATLLPKPGKWMVVLKKILAICLLATAVWIAYVLSTLFMTKMMNADAHWQDFNEPAIAAQVKEGKTVFVDVTAAWCLTCQANKRFILDKEDVKKEIMAPNVVLMKADWTSPSEVIAEYPRRHGRYGIPFNIIYGPSAPDGVILPELLTGNAVREGLKKAR
jgi:suppressor for copper-sensitivity B